MQEVRNFSDLREPDVEAGGPLLNRSLKNVTHTGIPGIMLALGFPGLCRLCIADTGVLVVEGLCGAI